MLLAAVLKTFPVAASAKKIHLEGAGLEKQS
jgi:hypothetical protein